MAEIGVISLEEINAPFEHDMSAHSDDKKAVCYPKKVQSLLVDALRWICNPAYPHVAIDGLPTRARGHMRM